VIVGAGILFTRVIVHTTDVRLRGARVSLTIISDFRSFASVFRRLFQWNLIVTKDPRPPANMFLS
jgi:hypothetical protein